MYASDLLAGRTVVITGGGSGLGRAMAERAGSLGARIGIIGRTVSKLENTVEAIRQAGGTAGFASADVRYPAQVQAAFDKLTEDLGPIDTLVNNAAGNFLCPTEDLSPNAFNAVVQIVLYGTFHCTQAFARPIIADPERSGQILNILTTYAWMGSPFVVPSAAAKAGVLAMMRSLAIEWATYGIRNNGIAPGPFPTEGAFSRLMLPNAEEQAKQHNPMGRFGQPEELANLAMYMISPMASYLNGECITLDGGEWIQHGQEFGFLASMDRDQLKQGMAAMRPKKKS